jgi:hypothetical protein
MNRRFLMPGVLSLGSALAAAAIFETLGRRPEPEPDDSDKAHIEAAALAVAEAKRARKRERNKRIAEAWR